MTNLGFWLLVGLFWFCIYLYESDKKDQEKSQYKKRFMFPFTK